MSDQTTEARRVALALESDLFFAVKVRDTLAHAGWSVVIAKSAADFAACLTTQPPPAIALAHIGVPGHNWREAIRSARAAGVPVLAFGSHIDMTSQTEARALGATRVIANSKLAADLVAQVEQTLARAQAASADRDDEPAGG